MSNEIDYMQRGDPPDSPSQDCLKEPELSLNIETELIPPKRSTNPPPPALHVAYFDSVPSTSTDNLPTLSLESFPSDPSYSANPRLSLGSQPDVIYFEHDVVIKEDEDKNVDLLLYRCNFKLCGFQSAEKEGITEHMKNYHGSSEGGGGTSKSKEFQCDICQMKFTVFANMQRHRMSHLGLRPFECRVCNKKFTRNDHLMEHIVRQHSKQRPYKCPFCVKSFSVRPSLKNHLASDHSGIPKDKVCRVCGFRASTVGGAKIHFTNTHLRNSAGSENAALGENSATPMEQSEEIDLASVSQNFEFQEVSVPTSTASKDSPEAFRRYVPSIDGPGPSGVSSSSINTSERPPCTSSGLKQEPLDPENSCSSSAGTQPTSTGDTMLPSYRHDDDDYEEEDAEVVNHMSSDPAYKRLSEPIPRPVRVERKPLINIPGSVTRYPDWRQPSETLTRSEVKSSDPGDSKVSTSNSEPTWPQELKPEVKAAAPEAPANPSRCNHCSIIFPDSTMYFLHRGLHSDSNPWKCNYCGELCNNKYDFYAHVIRKEHN